MTTNLIDIQNADVIMATSNMAENHPVGFQWVMKAKERGAKLIHVDPRFTRTSAAADVHVPLRSGTNIVFFGGLMNYAIEKDLYDMEPTELSRIKTMPGSLDEALDNLARDHAFLLKGGVFSKGALETWMNYKREKEVDAMRLRPHPYEFFLYFDI